MRSIKRGDGQVHGTDRAARGTFASLRIRNFRLFFFGQTVSQAGNWMTLVTQALLVLSITGNGFAVGVLTACQFLPVLVFGAWAGVIADRCDKRRLLIAVQTIAMVQSLVLAGLAFMHDPPVVAFYGVALVGGLVTAFDSPARRSFVVEMVPDDHVLNAVSLNSALMMGARAVGPALAGLVIQTMGFGWCFLIDGLSYLAVIAAYVMIRPNDLRRAPITPRAKGQVRAGVRYVRRTPDLWIPLVIIAIVGTLSYNFQVVVPLLATRTFGTSEATFTILFSVMSVGSLAGALLTARRPLTSLGSVILSTAAFGTTMVLFAAAPTLGVAFGAAALVGITSMMFMTSSTAIMQLRADETMRGRVLALQSMVLLGSTPVGGPILGAMCDAWNARAGLLVGGVAAFAAAGWGWHAVRQARGTGQAVSEAIPAIITTKPSTI